MTEPPEHQESADGESHSDSALLGGILANDNAALAKLLERYRPQLLGLVRMKTDRRLSKRIDAADVLQDAYLDASRRLEEYAANPAMPFPLWLKFLTLQRLTALHRHHLGAAMRDAGREVAMESLMQAHSESMAIELAGDFTSPSQVVARVELQTQLMDALEQLGPVDREVLRLRHFEELTNDEVAELLGLTKAGASNRYIRALRRLKDVVSATPGLGKEQDQGTRSGTRPPANPGDSL